MDLKTIIPDFKKEVFSKLGDNIGYYDYSKYRVSFLADKEFNLLFLLISGLADEFNRIKTELCKLKKNF